MVQGLSHRNIRHIEGNPKCQSSKKIDLYRADGYLSDAQNPKPHPLTHCIRVFGILIHTGKGAGELNQREGERGNSTEYSGGIAFWTNLKVS